MTWIPNVRFMLQIFLAELIFLYPAEKRRFFALRLSAAAVACIILAVVLPKNGRNPNLLLQFFHFIFLFLICTASMSFCFKIQAPELISSAAAGYAVQHIASHTMVIARYYKLVPDVSQVNDPNNQLTEAIPFLLISLLFWLTIGRYSSKHQCYKKADMRFNLISISIVFICVGLSRVSRYFGDSDSVTVSLYAIVSLLMALIIQLVLSRTVELQHNNDVINL